MCDSVLPDLPVVLFDQVIERQTGGQCDCDCDCACSGTLKYELLDSQSEAGWLLKRSPDSHSLQVDGDHAIYYGPFHAPAVLNKAAEQILTAFDRKAAAIYPVDRFAEVLDPGLFQGAVARLLEAQLLIPDRAEPVVRTISDSMLTAWLHVTDRCNLRCDYCYLPHAPHDMSWETGQSVVAASFRSAQANGFGRVKLKYSGGEALLRLPYVIRLHEYARNTSALFDIDLDGVVLSNGTLLTPPRVQEIRQAGLRLMVSLDGIDEGHDTQRSYIGGRSSCSSAMRGILAALEQGLTPDVSITVSGKNVEDLPAVVEWILDHDLPFSFNFYRENDLSISCHALQLKEQKIIEGVLDAYRVIESRLPRQSLLSALVDRANLSIAHSRTCGVGDNYLVFDSLGNVSKCQMQMSQAVTTARAGDPLMMIRTDQVGIQNLPVDQKVDCRDCAWKYWCTGGCPLSTFRAAGRYDVKSPNCNIYRTLYPAAMRLEGLRLMRYANAVL